MNKLCLALFISLFCISFCFAQNWQVLDSLCYKYGVTKPDSGILVGTKSIEGCIREKGKNSLEFAVCLHHVAVAYMNKNDFFTADSLYQQAIRVCKSINKTETAKYADIVNNLGVLYEEQKKYSKAESLYSEAVIIRAKVLGKEHPDYVESCVNLAVLYEISDRYSEAESLYIESKNITAKIFGKEHNSHALSCNYLANLYEKQGKYSEAEPLYIEARNIRAKTLGKEHPDYAASCNKLASLYKTQGRYPEAEPLYIEAKTIRAKVLGKEHSSYATSCHDLAGLYYYQSRYSEAEPLYKEAKEIYAKLYGKKHAYYAASCNNMALLYQAQGRYSEAEPLYIEAKTIREKIFGKMHPIYAISCNNLASLYEVTKRYSEAESLYFEAKNIYSRVFGKTHPYYTSSCNSLAFLYQAQNKFVKAEPLFIEVVTKKQKEIESNFTHLSEIEKEQYIRANVGKYYLNRFQRFVSRYYSQKPEVSVYGYELSLATKGLVLNNCDKVKNQILRSNDKEVKKLYSDWKTIKDRYNKVLNLTVEQRKEKRLNLDSLQKVADKYEKQLVAKSEDFAKAFTPKHVTWKDIQNKLENTAASVEIVRYEINKDSVEYMAYIIKKDSPYPEIVLFQNGNETEAAMVAYRNAIITKTSDDFSYNALWKPVQERLEGIKTVYFCPDGVYLQININTLQNPKTKKYVFEEIDVVQITNSKDILESKNEVKLKKETQKNIYLIGNPKYEIEKDIPKENLKESKYRDFSSGISQLPGAEKEVKTIDSLIKTTNNPAFLYIQEQATEELLKSLKNPHILHIATHGYFKRGKYQSAEQATLHAGILLSGVLDIDKMYIRPYNKDDGKLTAFEIMNMELDSTRWVILSNCETGTGEVSKEGIHGLPRAFKVAGANAVIMSLWKTDDHSTQEFMRFFYQNILVKKQDKKEAFTDAQNKLREKYPHPYYWGAFVMIE
jgi:CHAT domain-containing protein